MRTKGSRLFAATALALAAGLLAANNPVPRLEKDVSVQAHACLQSLESAFGAVERDIAA